MSFFLLNFQQGKAQSLIVTQKDGTTSSGVLLGSKITFSGTNLVFTPSGSSASQFALSNLSKITFDTSSSLIDENPVSDRCLAVYPNPATSFIRLKGLSDYSLVLILSIDGKLVYSQTLYDLSSSIIISSLPLEVYVVKTNGQTSKFIKQ